MNLKMKGITKSFGANNVLQGIDFTLSGGEICALLGENGAGKSTLMNILGGVLKADQGTISIDDRLVEFATPLDSLNAGVGFIHQELNLINDLAVYENMFISREIKKKNGLLDIEAMCEETRKVFERIEVEIDPKTMVRDLDASYKQIVEIARALMMNAKLIIMDEPTTSLTEPEIEHVFTMMRTLKKQGVGIVFISHKLREVMEFCDRYTVLRDGQMVAHGNVSDTSINELAKFMVGHEVRTESLRQQQEYGEEVLRLENLSLDKKFKDISLAVHKGEILGVTGLLGDGRTEVFQTVFGCMPEYSGRIFVEGQECRISSVQQAMDQGIGYVPRDRKENGIIKDMNIMENASIAVLPKMTRYGIIDKIRQKREFDGFVENLRIKLGKGTDLIGSLSGGNQQKVVLAKWLMANPKVLILDNPTQGVDVGAKEDIYNIILELAKQGIAVVILSSEAQEIIRICSRAVVMYHGTIQDELHGDEMKEETIMRLATGGHK
ncbi:sugar ABC transporter ATP-binding protein [Blautia sp.]|uniref:sugar ABC transporter ATP-binding protein n=1 Tax=Blautia sp. TaxID=1955243 RepID=UPI00280B898C|nr:sugar ABC transporter ATP-binding protein [Blautia sp.]MED9883255.1 sugar ABC transporter ATP-binding protein [Blautia sp.]